ncbi:hypothetical protein A2U01_0045695, partial [Trifolium medium]|nr:hypothetical protein [Trifolium medium]
MDVGPGRRRCRVHGDVLAISMIEVRTGSGGSSGTEESDHGLQVVVIHVTGSGLVIDTEMLVPR